MRGCRARRPSLLQREIDVGIADTITVTIVAVWILVVALAVRWARRWEREQDAISLKIEKAEDLLRHRLDDVRFHSRESQERQDDE